MFDVDNIGLILRLLLLILLNFLVSNTGVGILSPFTLSFFRKARLWFLHLQPMYVNKNSIIVKPTIDAVATVTDLVLLGIFSSKPMLVVVSASSSVIFISSFSFAILAMLLSKSFKFCISSNTIGVSLSTSSPPSFSLEVTDWFAPVTLLILYQ